MFTRSLISVTTQNSQWSNQPETQPEEAETNHLDKQSNIMEQGKQTLLQSFPPSASS